MEALTVFVYSANVLILLVLQVRSDTTAQQCSYINIHVVKEDGQPQILTVADPESDISCGCQQARASNSQCHSPAASRPPRPTSSAADEDSPSTRKLFQSTGPDGLPYPAHRIPMPPFQHGARYWGMAPTVTILIEDVMSKICGGRKDKPSICDVFKQLSLNCPPDSAHNRDYIEQCAAYLVENNLLPVPTGDSSADNRIAYGHVLIGAGLADEAVEYFTSIIREYPNLASAYHGRGMAFIKKGIITRLAERALADFLKASELEPRNAEHYQCMAELYIPLGKYEEALNSVKKAASLTEQPTSRILFLKATLELAAENFKMAELDYRESLRRSQEPQTKYLYYNLAVTLYYRGMLRNSIETYKELIKMEPDNTEAHCGLAHAYSILGDFINAKKVFNKTIQLDHEHLLSRQLKGLYHYNHGQLQEAVNEFQTCLQINPQNYICQYMEALSLTGLGHFYKAVKGYTKVVVQRKPAIKMSPEFIKSQYLREYARFLHKNLDEVLLDIDFDNGLPNEFKNNWIKLEPFRFRTLYTEQPGISPSISDVCPLNFKELPIDVREVICYARTIGSLTSSSTDGQWRNKRQELAVGLAAMHIAQAMRDVWEDVGASKTDRTVTWQQVFDIAVRYIQLVNPEEPIFWLNKMDKKDMEIGYTHDMYIIKGHTINAKMMHYFDLVYRLIRTMISVHCGEGEMYPEEILHELASAETYEQLIDVFHKDIFRDQGFVMSTQLSSMKNPNGPKHEGVMLSIASDKFGKMTLSINMPFNREKVAAVYQEMDYVFFELYNEIKKFGGRTTEDPDHIINLILSLVYYFLNLSPISHGSSAVAWSVAVGLIMSVGRDVTGRIAPGKLFEIEAALTGGPDVFSAVTKTWMKIKRMKDNPLLRIQHVSAVLPTLRDILEALTHIQSDCYEVFAISKNIIV